MIMEETFKALLTAALAALGASVAWTINKVLGNREDNLIQREQIRELEVKLTSLKDNQLSLESVRSVIEEALRSRDRQAQERRQQWDKALTLEIERAVIEGVKTCQNETKRELEQIVPRIVRDTIQQTRRHGGGS